MAAMSSKFLPLTSIGSLEEYLTYSINSEQMAVHARAGTQECIFKKRSKLTPCRAIYAPEMEKLSGGS